MKLKIVTVTGADTRTHIGDMIALSADYPNLEWGILLSKSSEGSRRFPTHRWMQSLLMQAPDIPCAGHLCGRYVQDLFAGEFTFGIERSNIVPLFRRFQVNFHGLEYGSNDALIDAMRKVNGLDQNRLVPVWISQMDGVNDFRFREALAVGLDVSPLFDQSHGEGVLPESWPVPLGFSGYAGGLGPDNLADELKRIEDVVGDHYIWIDAETKLRNDSDQFDIDYVFQFLKVAEPYF